MKTKVMSALCSMVLIIACNKKGPQPVLKTKTAAPAECGQEIILAREMKVKETGLVLPPATKICIANDSSEISIVLPGGYSYAGRGYSASPVLFATYHCLCSGGGTCQVMWGDEIGFGCLHSNCTGGCTGQFTYKGYSADRVVNLTDSKDDFFSSPAIQDAVAAIYQQEKFAGAYQRETIYGVSFYIVRDSTLFLSKASCDCEGTKACKLKVKELQFDKASGGNFKIYYCDGPCNGCELTVN